MKTGMEVFTSSEFGQVRVIMQNGEPWFVAKDVCSILEIANSRDAVASLDADEKGVATVDTPGGKQEMATVSESGLYALIFKSRKLEAKAFRKWVTSEVLPAIRKTGGYGMPDFSNPAVAARAWADEYEAKQAALAEVAKLAERSSALEEVIGIAQQWKQIKALDWVPEVFDVRNHPVVWNLLGKRASELSRALGYDIRKAPDSTYGEVNVYHIDIVTALERQCKYDSTTLAAYRRV